MFLVRGMGRPRRSAGSTKFLRPLVAGQNPELGEASRWTLNRDEPRAEIAPALHAYAPFPLNSATALMESSVAFSFHEDPACGERKGASA
jgi:hypothetical protein